MGNRGTFTKPWQQVLTDFEFMYNILYLLLCVFGLCIHEFAYSLLVSIYWSIWWVWFMVLNTTFYNISVMSWWSVLLMEETGENHRPVASHWQTLSHNVVLNAPRGPYLPSNPFSSGHTRKSSLSPSFPWTPVGTRILLQWPGIGPDIRNIYLFGTYRDFTYRKDNNPNGQLQSTTITFEVSN
jgi:hypothetical protein